MPNNTAINKAAIQKNDEFYTQLSDIEKMLKNYQKYFKNKTVLCNCDDPRISNFFKYFSLNFEKLKLKKLIITCYKNQQTTLFSKHESEKAIYLEYNGDRNNNKVPDPDEIGIFHLKGDGDFRSEECIEILKQADIVVTNPPFSLLREFVLQLMKYKKKFIIIGNTHMIAYNEIFPLIQKSKIWLDTSIHGHMKFEIPHIANTSQHLQIDGSSKTFVNMGGIIWYTNLGYQKYPDDLFLFKKYNKTEYPKYDNYNAININKTKEIPADYKGLMGVPITFFTKYNPRQFEIIGIDYLLMKQLTGKSSSFSLDGKELYTRIIIKHKVKE